MTDLGTVGGDPCTGALGINSKVEVVGWSGDCAVNLHAFLWENGRIIDLNAFNPPHSSLQQLLLAYNINDRGEIVGLGVPPGVSPGDVFNLGHAFVLIPCQGDDDGCQGENPTGVNQNSPAQVTQNPTTMTQGSRSSPSERIGCNSRPISPSVFVSLPRLSTQVIWGMPTAQADQNDLRAWITRF